MLTLGIETSCDETSVALVDRRKVLANFTLSSLKFHRLWGGIVPEIASRKQFKFIDKVYQKTLRSLGRSYEQIKLISVTQGPGLIGSLMVGVQFAKGLALALKKPLLGLDHLEAHLFAGFLGKKEIDFPFIGLVASGGHTDIYFVSDFGCLRLLGRTLDDACGEALDKVGRFYGLPYPAAVYIDKLFSLRWVDRKMFSLKRRSDFNVSFSGLKTAAVYKKKLKMSEREKKTVLSSLQYTIMESLILLLQKATETFKIKNVAVGGGVVANRYLRQRLKETAKERKWRLSLPEVKFAGDNAAAIAGLGEYLYNKKPALEADFEPYSVSKRT